MTVRQSVPALVTLVALACGLAALEATRQGAWDLALRLVLLAAIADGIDGPLARRLRAAGPMGKQLDSLADIVAFGVAPAFLFATYYADSGGAPDAARYAAALAFVGAGAYRLARFHTQPGNDVFHGLPITAAGVLLAVAVAGPFSLGVLGAGALALALAALMAGNHPFPKLAWWRWRLLPVLAAAAVPIALWPGVETLAIVAATVLGAYVLWGLTRRLTHAGAREVNRRTNEEEDEMPDSEPAPHSTLHSINGAVNGATNGARPSRWSFLRAFLRDRRTVGAVTPTSRGVAQRMARLAGVGTASAVAEFGPGTGAITKELLAALPADGRLWAFEVYPPFINHLCESIHDSRFTLLPQSAEAIAEVREQEAQPGFDAVVSSIPFSLIGPRQTAEILRAVGETLRDGGVFVALQYHPRYLAPLLKEEFTTVKREVYPWNIPPATLLTARGPRRADSAG